MRESSDSLDGSRKWNLCLALAIAQQLAKSNSRLALCKMGSTEVAHAMPWAALKKMMTDKYCPRATSLDGGRTQARPMLQAIVTERRQNTGHAYAAGNSDRKPYEGSKPLCAKCNFHHEAGPCPP
ncbi:hypothetical protein Tco_0176304, partial [Tanacetum coccineum]